MLFRHMSANKLYPTLEYVIAGPLKDYSVRVDARNPSQVRRLQPGLGGGGLGIPFQS